MRPRAFGQDFRHLLLVFLLLSCFSITSAQQRTDSSRLKNLVNRFKDNKAAKTLMHSLTRRQDTVFNVKSEDPYILYEGKIIRKITIERIGFEKNVIDTAHTIFSWVARTGNKLHNTTKEWVIRNNLFIREGKPLNSYRVADNERYLRDLEFILDSRIFVKPVEGTLDSVDLLVVTRDVFSLGGSFNPSGINTTKFSVQEANLGGMGQRVQYTGLFDNTRAPMFGSQLLYRKNNVVGSFINASLTYSTIMNGSPYGRENERSFSVDLSRPLFMPYTRWAGGVTLSRNHSANVFNRPDTVFQHYHYNVQDYWVGYSFGHKKKLKDIRENRNRKFFAVRAFQQHYTVLPDVPLNINDRALYNNRTSLLGQLTFFRQDFYKTRYVLGFGRTEDIPYGYRLSVTGGWENERRLRRPYAGAEIYRSIVFPKGSFFTYTVRLASYYRMARVEDALLSVNLTRYSRIYQFRKTKVRHQLDLGYAQQFNNSEIKRQLDINDVNGISRFRPDTLLGNRRMNLRSETIIYTPWKVLGFNVAPLARIELAYLSAKHETVFQSKNFFTGFSGGVRVRNENLIFNTIEARVFLYPHTVEGISNIGFNIQANLKIKYPTILVSAPATVYN